MGRPLCESRLGSFFVHYRDELANEITHRIVHWKEVDAGASQCERANAMGIERCKRDSYRPASGTADHMYKGNMEYIKQ